MAAAAAALHKSTNPPPIAKTVPTAATTVKGCSQLQAASALNGVRSWWGRRVSEGAFGVLADMISEIVTTAAIQEDWRVVVAALQMADCISCATGTGVRRRLIASLSNCPTLYTEWFWSGAFAFAVSSAYLGGENRADLQDVVAAMTADFAHLVTGVGITGNTAWALLSRLAVQHLTHLSPLAPHVTAALRAHLAHVDALSQMDHGSGLGYGGGPPLPVPPSYRASAPVLTPQLPTEFARLLVLGGLPVDMKMQDDASTNKAVSQLPTRRDMHLLGPRSGAATLLPVAAAAETAAAGAAAGAAAAAAAAEPGGYARGQLSSSPSMLSVASGSSFGLRGTLRMSATMGGRGPAAEKAGALKAAARSGGRPGASYAAGRLPGKPQQQLVQQPSGLSSPQPQAPAVQPDCRSLLKPGGVQWANVHGGAVMALAAGNNVVVTSSLDNTLKVLRTGDGGLRSFASISLLPSRTRTPSRRNANAPCTGRALAPPPGTCITLAPDAAMGAVGNVDGYGIWLLDVKSGSPAMELDGEFCFVRVALPGSCLDSCEVG